MLAKSKDQAVHQKNKQTLYLEQNTTTLFETEHNKGWCIVCNF